MRSRRLAPATARVKATGQCNFFELDLDGHPQVDLVDVAKNEKGFEDPAERLEGRCRGCFALNKN